MRYGLQMNYDVGVLQQVLGIPATEPVCDSSSVEEIHTMVAGEDEMRKIFYGGKLISVSIILL